MNYLFHQTDSVGYDTWRRLLRGTYLSLLGPSAGNTFDQDFKDRVDFMCSKADWLQEWKDSVPSYPNPYHNFGHMADVFVVMVNSCSYKVDTHLQLAALYHDYGYDPEKHDSNILVACGRALRDMTYLGLLHLIKPVINAIKETGDHFAKGNVSHELLKADLSILTKKDMLYKEYAGAIRKEYPLISDAMYHQARGKALGQLIRRCLHKGYFTLEEMSEALKEKETCLSESPDKSHEGKHALYAGTFDPFHKGHLYVIREALKKGMKVTVAILANPNKNPAVTVGLRKALIKHELLKNGIYLPPVIVAEGGDTVGVMAEAGCSVLLRGVRSEDPQSVNEERNRALILKAEAGVETVLIPTQGKVSSYSSSAAKLLMGLSFPCSMVSSVVKASYEDMSRPRITLVVGGIATGKSTYCKKRESSNPLYQRVIDLDVVAKTYLAKHPVFSKQDRITRLMAYSSFPRYQKYMSRVKPVIMAGLHQELSLLPQMASSVVVTCNKLGLLWEDLLRMANYRVVYMQDISEKEAHSRVISRGSNINTMVAVLKLEKYAPTHKDIFRLIQKKTNAIKAAGILTESLFYRYGAFSLKGIPQEKQQ